MDTVRRATISELLIVADLTKHREPHAKVMQPLKFSRIIYYLDPIIKIDQEGRILFVDHREASFLSCSAK